MLAALLTVGSLSDHVGRRPVLMVAIAAQAVTMLIFAFATGVPELMTAREYGVGVIVLATVALLGLAWPRRQVRIAPQQACHA